MGDPLGLTLEQRALSDVYAYVQGWAGAHEHNRKVIESLPVGTIIRVWGQPDRTREHMLELML